MPKRSLHPPTDIPLFSLTDLDNYSSIFNLFSLDYSAYSFICYWLLLLSIMFSGPPTLYHISVLYYFILQNSIPFVYRPHFIYPFIT